MGKTEKEPKKGKPTSPPDKMVKTGKKGAELSETEMKKISGGIKPESWLT